MRAVLPRHLAGMAESQLQRPAGVLVVIPVQECQTRERYMNSPLTCERTRLCRAVNSLARNTLRYACINQEIPGRRPSSRDTVQPHSLASDTLCLPSAGSPAVLRFWTQSQGKGPRAPEPGPPVPGGNGRALLTR